ncbi:MAG: hypothetical protein SOZ52_01610 [Pyramidobacter sp.]|nr:hypothetical protein [Pyramidobacter sp.]
MLRVLDPAEQSCLTLEAQSLIYQYQNKNWLSPQQIEQLITETVIISQIRQTPGDAKLVTSVLMAMGDSSDTIAAAISLDQAEEKKPRLLS